MSTRLTIDMSVVNNEGEDFFNNQDSVDASIRPEHDIKKVRRKTDCSHQKQHRQRKFQQNKNNQKAKIGRKTILWTI